MTPLHFVRSKDRPLSILCLGAHSDDIEIGCGGALIKLIETFPESEFLWVVLSANDTRAAEARKSAGIYLDKVRHKEILVESFRDSFFPYQGQAIKEYFEKLKPRMNPDIVFAPYRRDLHQDHRLVSELTWNTFRNHLILEYEILKYDGDLGTPNMFVPLDRNTCSEKIGRLMACFKSQSSASWFEEECFYSLMRVRGVESNSPSRYAEAFYCRKASLDFDSM